MITTSEVMYSVPPACQLRGQQSMQGTTRPLSQRVGGGVLLADLLGAVLLDSLSANREGCNLGNDEPVRVGWIL